jgi:xylulose-5-phosphate/fructose-6-phosphate phosphoketolase
MEARAATALLREHFPDLKVRLVNVVDPFRLVPDTEHLPARRTKNSTRF